MPKTYSAKRALRKSAKRRQRNLKKKRGLKDALKRLRKRVAAGETAQTEEQLRLVTKLLDKAAKTKLLKKNTASRLKSRLAKKVARLTTQSKK